MNETPRQPADVALIEALPESAIAIIDDRNALAALANGKDARAKANFMLAVVGYIRHLWTLERVLTEDEQRTLGTLIHLLGDWDRFTEGNLYEIGFLASQRIHTGTMPELRCTIPQAAIRITQRNTSRLNKIAERDREIGARIGLLPPEARALVDRILQENQVR